MSSLRESSERRTRVAIGFAEIARAPRLVYIGEVPPRAISAGPSVLFRLFERYPPDRLLICEDSSNRPDPARQLPGVEHVRYPLVQLRWLRTRLAERYGSWLYLRSTAVATRLIKPLRAFGAEAVVSIGHGYGWWPAWIVSRRLNLPFHLIVHDHWRDFLTIRPELNRSAERRFAAAYRGAASRLVISPAMSQQYLRDYGSTATVLYPSRRFGAAQLNEPPARVTRTGRFVFAYAGGLASRWAKLSVIRLAHAVAPLGGDVRIHQDLRPEELSLLGLRTDNVRIIPFQSAESLLTDLISNSDALYLPMSFASEDRRNVELCFPSKLVEYTAVGRPLLINAPSYSSAVKWALANPGAGEIVDAADEIPLRQGAHRLMNDPQLCHEYARTALRAGNRDFSHNSVFATFMREVFSSRPNEQPRVTEAAAQPDANEAECSN